MHNISIQRQRGFTLVEIAIVLVIIGLLLGGILKGQELITSARVRNIADQNSGVQAAYFGFIDRYRQIPGDMAPVAACDAIGTALTGCPGAGIGGNGNGRLDSQDDAAAAGADVQFGEASALWSQLSSAGFIQGNYVGGAASAATYQAQNIAPINAFNGYIMLTRTSQYQPAGGSVRLAMVLGKNIPVNVMRELDVKIDDGLPDSGVLRITVNNGGTLGDVATSNAACVGVAGGGGGNIWNIDGAAQDCNAIYLY
jgi:prepilin-type N-terminal cleavage/methylation domain-containing protein